MKIFDYSDLLSDDESSFFIAADWLEEQNRDYEAECLRQGYVFGVWIYFLDTHLNYMFGHDYDYGYGYGEGDGTGTGYGDGDGTGTGYGYSYGDGDGYGIGYSNGIGYGYGYGDGTGYSYDASNDFGKFLLMFFASISQNVLKL
jgi:hypothetical protein